MELNKKIGILGGGQLGKMLCQAASPLHLDMHILDRDSTFPASWPTPNFHLGDFTSYSDVVQFGAEMDTISIEIEKVNLEALMELEQMGKEVIPSSKVVSIIRDKGLQKQFYHDHGFPTSHFRLFDRAEDIRSAIARGMLDYPFVQKARRDGYDGRGVAIIREESDLGKLMDTASVIEDLVLIDKELAIIVARNPSGKMTCFPLVEMEFDPEANLVNMLLCPADVEESIEESARALGYKLAESLELTGLLAIELFLDHEGTIWVNEVAPRPHNSGHHTIEACNHSQYDIHLRCLLDAHLPTITLLKSAGMLNLLGSPGYQGLPLIEGVDTLFEMEDAYLHWYGKPETRPNRKMGHVTVLGDTMSEIRSKLSTLSKEVKVKS